MEPDTSTKARAEPSGRSRATAVREAAAELSLTTRLLLSGYGLYVLYAWIFGVAPGQIALPYARVDPVQGPLQAATSIHRVTDDELVVELGSQEHALVELSRLVVRSRWIAPGRIHGVTRYDDSVHLLAEADDGSRHRVLVPDGEAAPAITEVHPRALWPMPDGTAMGHGLTDFMVADAWGKHPSGRPARLSGHLALVQMAWGQPDPDGMWPQLPDSVHDDLMILDAENSEPLGWLDTNVLTGISAAPSVPGFLLLDAGFPSMVRCDDPGCRIEPLHLRTDTHPIEHLDHRAAVRRIAACTPTEMYLYAYEVDPLEEAVVYLGRATLPAPCTGLAILDDAQVLVTGDAGAHRVRFTEDADG